jgi:hypothetical protein
MNETPVPSNPVAVKDPRLGRLWVLTFISLALNALILLFILVGIIVHHHRMKEHRFAGGREGFHGGPACGCGGGFEKFHRFHHFGGGGEGFGRGGMEDFRHGGRPEGGMEGFGPHQGWGGPRGGYDRHEQGPGVGGMADHDPAKMTDGILQHLSETLNLTDDQKAKMKPIIQADVEQFQKDAETERQAMQKRMEDDKAKLKPLLNADQQKALDAMPMPGHPPAGDGEMGGEIPPPAPGK